MTERHRLSLELNEISEEESEIVIKGHPLAVRLVYDNIVGGELDPDEAGAN